MRTVLVDRNIREWQAIWTVINNEGLCYQRASNIRACGIPDWSLQNNDEAFKERLADAVFYTRYLKEEADRLARTNGLQCENG